MYNNAIKVLELLEDAGFNSLLAGGCVRDRLLGIDPDDYDVATSALPQDVIRILTSNNINVVPTGIDHGTVSAVFGNRVIEITTLRKDVTPMGRRALVEFGGVSFKEDASRRDFTVNAMFEDRSGKIYDYFGGADDIKNKRLRFVGDASLRIQEDYLRILRFFRFWAKLEFSPLKEDLIAIKEHLSGLRCVSVERIISEIKKIFSYQDITNVLESMFDTGVLSQIFSDFIISREDLKSISDLSSLTRQKDFLYIFRLSYISKKTFATSPTFDKKSLELFLKNLKLSNLEVSRILYLSCFEDYLVKLSSKSTRSELMDFIDTMEKELKSSFCQDFIDYFNFCLDTLSQKKIVALISDTESLYHNLRVGTIPVNGFDIKKEFHPKSEKQIGSILTYLKQEYRLSHWTTYKEALSLVKDKFFTN